MLPASPALFRLRAQSAATARATGSQHAASTVFKGLTHPQAPDRPLALVPSARERAPQILRSDVACLPQRDQTGASAAAETTLLQRSLAREISQ